MAPVLDPPNTSMTEQPEFVLMYRRPGSDEYEKITDALDDLFIRVAKLEEEVDTKPGLTD